MLRGCREAGLRAESSAPGALWDSKGECHGRRCGAKRQARPGDFSARPACMPSRVPQERCGTQRENAMEGGVERSDRQDREISRRGRLACRAECPRSAIAIQRRMPWKAVWTRSGRQGGRFLGEAGLRAEPRAPGALCDSKGECHGRRCGAKRQNNQVLP